MTLSRPIVFLSDYGLTDGFVGICHGVIARAAPDVRVIDLTHAVPRHDVLRGALTLAGAARFMPERAVYLAVVDPGVGSARRSIAVETASGAHLVGPDNGLLSIAWGELGGETGAVEISSDRILLEPVSRTFHGRDVFAPAAAHLAHGSSLPELGPSIPTGELRRVALPPARVRGGRVDCAAVGLDRFGNVRLNIGPGDLATAGLALSFRLGPHALSVVDAFADSPEGEPAAIVDSDGFVTLFVNRGSAAERLGIRAGDRLTLE
ncbi:MAG: SAM hydrolase/SAM-dependent halogenase family protein [Actinomycetota bacterium]